MRFTKRGRVRTLSGMLKRITAALSAIGLLAGCPSPSPLHEVADVYARFSAAANDHDWDAMAAMFDPEATWEAGAGPLGFHHRGRPAIHSWLLGNRDKLEVLFYLAAPPRIDLVSPEKARAQTSMNELLLVKSTGEVKQLFGVYHDELRKQDGRWLFVARRFELRRELSVAPR